MKILMIIARNNFRDEEFQIPYNYFISKKAEVEVASTEKGICKGVEGCEADADLSFEEVKTEEYNAIVLIGGPGSKDLDENQELERILIEAKENNILLAAICRAPIILAKAGVIDKQKATVFPSEENIAKLKEYDVNYQESSVVEDVNLITADGPEAAEHFAVAIISHL